MRQPAGSRLMLPATAAMPLASRSGAPALAGTSPPSWRTWPATGVALPSPSNCCGYRGQQLPEGHLSCFSIPLPKKYLTAAYLPHSCCVIHRRRSLCPVSRPAARGGGQRKRKRKGTPRTPAGVFAPCRGPGCSPIRYYTAFCRSLCLYRLVGEDHRTRPGRLCGDEFHSFERIPIFEKPFPAAYNHGVDQQDQLIKKILLEQRVHKARTPGYADVLAWLLLELSKLLGEIPLEGGSSCSTRRFSGYVRRHIWGCC